MLPSSFAVALPGLALGLLALGAFVWAWRRGQFSRLRAQSLRLNDAAHLPRLEVLRYAAVGGLVGLILTALLAFALIAMPGNESPGAAAVVQLLGPEIGVVAGAALGALWAGTASALTSDTTTDAGAAHD